MAANRRKARAPRIEPITKDNLSGSRADSSPEDPGAQDHRRARSHMHVHPHSPGAPTPILPWTRRPAAQPGAPLHTASGLEGPGRRLKAGAAPGLSSPPPSASPSLSRLPLTLRQCLEIDLAPKGAVACGSPCPDLEAIDVAGAQLRHSGCVGLDGQSEGMGFILCLGGGSHSLPAPCPSPLTLAPTRKASSPSHVLETPCCRLLGTSVVLVAPTSHPLQWPSSSHQPCWAPPPLLT